MEKPVRRIPYLVAAVILSLAIIGCGRTRQPRYYQQASAGGAPRVNLYPLTQGSAQPLQGYAPTRITASTTYAPAGYYDNNAAYAGSANYAPANYTGGATYNTASYNPGYNNTGSYGTYGGGNEPFPTGNYCPPWAPAGANCTVENMTSGMNPMVPIKDPPVVVNNLGNVNVPYGSTSYTQQPYAAPTYSTTSYTSYNTYNSPPALSATAGYGVTTAPAAPGTEPFPTGNYCPPWAAAGASCTVENMTPGMNPMVPIKDPPVVVNNLGNVGGSYGATMTNTYSTNSFTSYTPPSLSANTYAGGPVDMSMYGTTGNVPGGVRYETTYGQVQGTADLLGSSPYAGGAYPRATADIPASQGGMARQPAAPVQDVRYGPNEVRLVPALDVPPGNHPNDAAPSQWFEIVRPGNGPMRIGRVSATCVCVSVRVPNRYIKAGERALVEARIVSKPPVNNLTYGIYVNIAEPIQTVVDADVTITYR